jgi:hypothetical protein
MPQPCKACHHAERAAIDRDLVAGFNFAEVGRRYGLRRNGVARHFRNHLPKELTRAHGVEVAVEADSLMARMEQLIAKAERIGERAEAVGDGRLALQSVRELRGVLELLARVSGELKKTTVHQHISVQWISIRGAIFSALEPFPEARARLVEALAELEPGE